MHDNVLKRSELHRPRSAAGHIRRHTAAWLQEEDSFSPRPCVQTIRILDQLCRDVQTLHEFMKCWCERHEQTCCSNAHQPSQEQQQKQKQQQQQQRMPQQLQQQSDVTHPPVRASSPLPPARACTAELDSSVQKRLRHTFVTSKPEHACAPLAPELHVGSLPVTQTRDRDLEKSGVLIQSRVSSPKVAAAEGSHRTDQEPSDSSVPFKSVHPCQAVYESEDCHSGDFTNGRNPSLGNSVRNQSMSSETLDEHWHRSLQNSVRHQSMSSETLDDNWHPSLRNSVRHHSMSSDTLDEDWHRKVSDTSGLAREEWSKHLKEHVQSELRKNSSRRFNNKKLARKGTINLNDVSGRLTSLVSGNLFQALCASTIVVNAIVIGYSSNVSMANVLRDPPISDPEWMDHLNVPFTVVYTVEFLLRLFAYRWYFVVGPEWKWNAFDLTLLVLSIGEEVVKDMGSASLRVIRGLRMFRVLRMLRVLRFFRDLRMMVCSILQSLGALSWALILLLIIMYLFTIFFMHGAMIHLQDHPNDTLVHVGVSTWYGNLWDTMYTMLASITGGIDWTEAVQPLEHISMLFRGLWVFYIVFVVIGVLNVLTGIFVERACELSGLDQDLVIQAEMRRGEKFLVEMKRIFEEADADGSGWIDWEEFNVFMKNPRVQAYLASRQLDAFDARSFFDMVRDGSEEINIETFIIGCQRMKGMAKNVDLLAILRETRETKRTLKALMRKIGASEPLESCTATIELAESCKPFQDADTSS